MNRDLRSLSRYCLSYRKSMFKFCRPVESNMLHIAQHMRHADQVEVMASHGQTPRQAIFSSVKLSNFCTIATLEDDTPFAVFGLVLGSCVSGKGSPWLLGTDDIDRNVREFVEYSRQIVGEMQERCKYLENYVHCDNRKSIRWLKAMGFTVSPSPIRYGVAGELFYHFHSGEY